MMNCNTNHQNLSKFSTFVIYSIKYLPKHYVLTHIRLYLGCFGWVINVIYSTLFSNILHAFRHNITYAQNLGLSNCYALFMCSDLMGAIILSREDA